MFWSKPCNLQPSGRSKQSLISRLSYVFTLVLTTWISVTGQFIKISHWKFSYASLDSSYTQLKQLAPEMLMTLRWQAETASRLAFCQVLMMAVHYERVDLFVLSLFGWLGCMVIDLLWCDLHQLQNYCLCFVASGKEHCKVPLSLCCLSLRVFALFGHLLPPLETFSWAFQVAFYYLDEVVTQCE